jgi:hypothetical protein
MRAIAQRVAGDFLALRDEDDEEELEPVLEETLPESEEM